MEPSSAIKLNLMAFCVRLSICLRFPLDWKWAVPDVWNGFVRSKRVGRDAPEGESIKRGMRYFSWSNKHSASEKIFSTTQNDGKSFTNSFRFFDDFSSRKMFFTKLYRFPIHRRSDKHKKRSDAIQQLDGNGLSITPAIGVVGANIAASEPDWSLVLDAEPIFLQRKRPKRSSSTSSDVRVSSIYPMSKRYASFPQIN